MVARADIGIGKLSMLFLLIETNHCKCEIKCCKFVIKPVAISRALCYNKYILIFSGRCVMAVSYNKLWKKLIDLEMSRTELRLKAGLSTRQLAKLGKNENVTTDVLVKVCKAARLYA